MKKFILSIDQGTTSTRSILFDLKGKPFFISQKEFKQYFPKDGWVEHNPEEIWKTTKIVLKNALLKIKKIKGEILTLGITNQRETTIIWDKQTGKSIYNAIVWQDRRTSDLCENLKNGVPIAIVGETNTGNSTLLNSILNDERSIVSDIPGTTRDTIEDELILDVVNYRCIDTA